MSEILDVNTYQPKFGESFFFDNNIWVMLFYPQGNVNQKKQKIYSDFLNKIRRNNCAVFINSLILSEFCNYWLQTDFKIFKSKSNNDSLKYKKDFVGNETFKQSVINLKEVIKKILKTTEKASDDFNSVNFDNVMSEIENCDFNDSYYLELARNNKWKIVTEDTDLFEKNKLNICIITT